MRAVVQRVTSASVTRRREVVGADRPRACACWSASPTTTPAAAPEAGRASSSDLRIFEDEDGAMNRSAADVGARCWWSASSRSTATPGKGRRPSLVRPPRAGGRRAAGRRSGAALRGARRRRSRPAASARTWRSSWSTTAPSRSCSSSDPNEPETGTTRPSEEDRAVAGTTLRQLGVVGDLQADGEGLEHARS